MSALIDETRVRAPFPDDVPTHPLVVIDYALLKAGDENEAQNLWKASTEIGFWYMKNHGVEKEVDLMYQMGAETINLPLDEKLKFDQGDSGMSFGYKAAGAWGSDAAGTPDSIEFLNISQDDALAYPKVVHRTYPETVNNHMDDTIKPFMNKSIEIHNTLLEVFDKLLGFPVGTLKECHRLDQTSGTETRNIRNPPNMKVEQIGLGAHTDFGTMTFLHNRQGGLQVLPPGYEEWQYIKPYPGHAVCNLGDAMVLFSGGLLHSNLHRVIGPPGEQAAFPRWSLAWLSRPSDPVNLRALVDKSDKVAEAVKSKPGQSFETGSTAGEWFARRVKNARLSNRKGPETYYAFRGTEHSTKT